MLLAPKNVRELSVTVTPVFRKSGARLQAKNCGRDSAGCFDLKNFKGLPKVLSDAEDEQLNLSVSHFDRVQRWRSPPGWGYRSFLPGASGYLSLPLQTKCGSPVADGSDAIVAFSIARALSGSF